MPRGRLAVVAIAAALGGCGQRAPATTPDTPETRAQALRDRLATDPRDPELLIALAILEEQRGRPGAALAALDRAELLGRPFRAGLGGDARARLAALVRARAEVRADRGSPDADADAARARRLGASLDPDLPKRAALAAIAGELRSSDPDRRGRGAARLRTVDAELARGLDPGASDDALESTTAWLVAVGAKRVAYEALDRVAEAATAAGRDPFARASLVERWLALRRWWSGQGDPIDRPTLDRARALGASSCAYATGPADPGCDVLSAAAGTAPFEAALVAAWEREGWQAPDRERALAWGAVADRAVTSGLLVSWERAVADHVAPADRDAVIAAHVEAFRSLPPSAARPRAWSELAALAAGAVHGDGLVEVVAAYATDPALADRRAEDYAARAIDLAAAGPIVATAFRILGDPARARAWWQRAFDASPEDPAIALGLAIAMADAGDPPAGLQLAVRAAAGSGDAPAALYRAARGFAAAGQTLDALTLARQAIEVSAPGDEDAPAGLAAELLRALGRPRDAAEVGALAALPSAFDLTGVRAEVARVTAGAAAHRCAAIARSLALIRSPDPAAAAAGAALLRSIARESPTSCPQFGVFW